MCSRLLLLVIPAVIVVSSADGISTLPVVVHWLLTNTGMSTNTGSSMSQLIFSGVPLYSVSV